MAFMNKDNNEELIYQLLAPVHLVIIRIQALMDGFTCFQDKALLCLALPAPPNPPVVPLLQHLHHFSHFSTAPWKEAVWSRVLAPVSRHSTDFPIAAFHIMRVNIKPV